MGRASRQRARGHDPLRVGVVHVPSTPAQSVQHGPRGVLLASRGSVRVGEPGGGGGPHGAARHPDRVTTSEDLRSSRVQGFRAR